MRKPTFFARRALLVLVVVFFFVPFALRGARIAVQGMKNDVKDWLPKDFVETTELDWFRKHFVSEQFVVVSWQGCYGGENDERFKMFVAKLMPEMPPSRAAKAKSQATEVEADVDPATLIAPPLAARNAGPDGVALATAEMPIAETAAAPEDAAENEVLPNPTKYLAREDFVGDYYGLYLSENDYYNWGGQQEKWLRGLKRESEDSNDECWYYITPEGDLYRWDSVNAPVASVGREAMRRLQGPSVDGTLVHSFGDVDGPWYYENPRRLRAQLFKTLTTGPDVLASLVGPGGELESDPAEAQRRLSGTLFGKEGKQTCLVLTLTEAAKRNLHLVLGRGVLGKPRGQLYEVAGESNISEDELRLGGPPVDNVAIDEEGSITLFRLIGLCGLLGVSLSLICFRSISATIMVFFVGAVSAVLSLAFVWWGGSSVDAILMSMPALVYVLGLSGATHIMNYYQEAVCDHGYEGAPERAVAHGWKPALLCNITTAIGLMSLYTSELTPIRKFGVFSAIGVLATLLILFTYLPAALQIWPQKLRKKPQNAQRGPQESWLESLMGNFWQSVGGFIIRHHALVSIGFLLFIGFAGYGATYINTSVNMLRMFHKDAKIIRDYEWLEANLGDLVPMEVVVRIDPKLQLPPAAERAEQQEADPNAQFQLTFLERMELAARVQRVIEQEFGAEGQKRIGKAMSAATFVRELPEPRGDTRTMLVRGSTNSRLEAHRDEFLHSDYLRIEDEGAELWRVSLRVGATQGTDYGTFIHELKNAVEPVLAAQRERENVLRQIVALRNGKRPAGAKVLLLGVPAEEQEAAEAKGETNELARQPINKTKIFADTLNDLLTVSRLKVKTQSASETPSPDEQKLLAGQDCIVLVGDCPAYDLAELKQHARLVIDARDAAERSIGSPLASVAAAANMAPPQIGAVYTGVVPIVYKAQRTLLESLIESTLWSFLTITPLMMIISRSVGGGLVAMLPNALPVLVIFGGMGWLGIDVDIGSMMTASIALGVAVDDTIHYLNWFRDALNRLGDRKAAILAAYRHCATPTIQAATMSGLGLSIFAISTFTPTQRFGCLMLAILWAGVVAELFFFPALLAGPLGLLFKPSKKAQASPADGSDSPESLERPTAAEPVTERLILPISTEPPVIEPLEMGSGIAGGMHTGPGSKSNLLRSLRQDRPHRPRA